MRKKEPHSTPRADNGVLAGKKLIAVALPLLSEGEISLVTAIREELGRRGDFEVMVLSGGYEGLLRKVAERGELAGAIGDFMSEVWLESLLSRGVKVVRIDNDARGSETGINSIGVNNVMMGDEAARTLMRSGVQSLGYLGPTGAPGSVRLGECFNAACATQGREVSRCSSTAGVPLKNFILSLARPAGLLCSSDHLARMAILTAQQEGLRVPENLNVIGVGNVRTESLHAGVEISSFELPLTEIGRLAGAAMVDLLEGRHVRPATVDPLLHERESSLHSDSGVERALAWLKSHPDTAITAGELARMAGMSRRSFETAIRASRGISPGKLLQEMRRARAEKLLRDSNLDISSVGRECGYPEAAAFSTAFKRWTGRSPREFRQSFLTESKGS